MRDMGTPPVFDIYTSPKVNNRCPECRTKVTQSLWQQDTAQTLVNVPPHPTSLAATYGIMFSSYWYIMRGGGVYWYIMVHHVRGGVYWYIMRGGGVYWYIM